MNWYDYLFSKDESADSLQMIFRGLLVFSTAVILLRCSGKRTFGKGNPVDNLVVIILGGMLSRVITGAASYFPVIWSVLALLLLYRILSWISLFKRPSVWIMGKKTILFENGSFIKKAMDQTMTSEEDCKEAMRLKMNTEDFHSIEHIIIERNGEISVIKKTEN